MVAEYDSDTLELGNLRLRTVDYFFLYFFLKSEAPVWCDPW